MNETTVTHATFTLERRYSEPPDQVFAAWANQETKRRWFAAGDSSYQLDFRVGGREVNRAEHNGMRIVFESFYRDIVANERIVYGSVLSQDDRPATVSLTTVEIHAEDEGTRLVLTEQGAFLDDREQPAWREEGTGNWLTALAGALRTAVDEGTTGS